MKNLVKWFGIIALVAMVGFSFSSCGDDGGGGGNNGGGGKTSPLLDSIADMRVWLAEQPSNTKSSAYTVKLNIDDTANFTDLKTLLINAADKYVYLDISYGLITTIPSSAFSSCATLTGITIPNSIKEIKNRTFSECTNLASVTIGSGVTSIGNFAFYKSTSLASITIPNNVEGIGERAFSECISLARVTIGSGVTWVNYDAFFGCTSLTVINVDADNSTYSAENGILLNKNKTTLIAYPAVKGAFTIPYSITNIGENAFNNCTSLTSVTIPDSITSIERNAFYSCTSLTSVTIGSGVTSIGYFAFTGCTSLAVINVATDNGAYSAENGILFNKNKTTLIAYPAVKGTFTIPYSVTSIAVYAFQGCTNLSSVIIPDSVNSIAGYAFYSCTSLTSATIGSGVTSIAGYAFQGCTNLISVTFQGTIPESGFGNDWYDDSSFPGDLRRKFYAANSTNGTPGTYTRDKSLFTWTKQS